MFITVLPTEMGRQGEAGGGRGRQGEAGGGRGGRGGGGRGGGKRAEILA